MITQRLKLSNFTASLTNLNRDDLEDKFFRLKDEHLELKKEAHNAEYQMKFLNAKLARLISEKKRLLNREKTKRETELEELIYDLQERASQLDRENVRLKEKTLVLRIQLETEMTGKRSTSSGTYSHVHSRTDSGLGTPFKPLSTRASSALVLNRRPNTSTELSKNMRWRFNKQLTTNQSLPSYAFNLLHEAQEEIKRLEDVVAMQQTHIETLHESRKLHAFDNNLAQTSSTSKTTINNIIATQPQHHYDESTSIVSTDEETSSPNNNIRKDMVHVKHRQMINHHLNGKKISEEVSNLIERLQKELALEKVKVCDMKKKLLGESALNKAHTELEQRIQTLEKENDILRKSLEECIGSCLSEIGESVNQEKTRSIKSNDSAYDLHELEKQISDLHCELRSAKSELHNEKRKYVTLYNAYQQLLVSYNDVKQKLESNTAYNTASAATVTQITTTITDISSDSSPKSRDPTIIENNNGCNRSDHFELTEQLLSMQTERQLLLVEFEHMKHSLQLVQNSLISQPQSDQQSDN